MPALAGGKPGVSGCRFRSILATGSCQNIEARPLRQQDERGSHLPQDLAEVLHAVPQSPYSYRSSARRVMTQTTNRFLDEVARLMNDAAAVAQGVRREVDTLFKTQAERWLRDLDLVRREEFEAVKDMARL